MSNPSDFDNSDTPVAHVAPQLAEVIEMPLRENNENADDDIKSDLFAYREQVIAHIARPIATGSPYCLIEGNVCCFFCKAYRDHGRVFHDAGKEQERVRQGQHRSGCIWVQCQEFCSQLSNT